MYQDIGLIKKHVFKTLLDDYEAEDAIEVAALSKLQPAAFVRRAIQNEIKRFHVDNSINRDAPQRELFNDLKRA